MEQSLQSLPKADYRAIRTRYVGPTNTRGARIIGDAGDSASRVTLPYDHSLNLTNNHAAAAVAVTEKMGWAGEYFSPLIGGEYGHDYFWVFQGARP